MPVKKLTFDVSREVPSPCGEVWDLLTDTRRWKEWGPSVREVQCRHRYLSDGVRGRVRTPFGLWLPFEVSEYVPGYRWSWRVAGLPATGHRVEACEGSGCRVVFEVPLLAAPYALVCAVAARRIARILRGGTSS